MVVDHIGLLFFPHDPLWRVFGRLAFPLFAFLVAEGFTRTSNVRNYLFRLLGFAVISQLAYLPFNYATGWNLAHLNIFFTLSAGLIAIILVNRLSLFSSIPAVILISAFAGFASFDYGAYGVLTVLLSRLVLTHRRIGLTALFFYPQALTFFRFLLGVPTLQFFASMSVPLIAVYNGERGLKLPRALFYWFYPVHLLVLSLIWYFR